LSAVITVRRLLKLRPAILACCLLPLLAIILFDTSASAQTSSGGYALRFYGNGVNAPDLDRVKIRIDNPPGPPADVGATDFTLEFWMKALAAENTAASQTCGANLNWIYGNIVFDRDRFNQDRKYGLSIAGGRFVFGVSGDGTGDRTICGVTDVLDNAWHHVAVQRRRSDGWMWLFVDGRLEAQEAGPVGDVSYPDNATPGDFCDGPCTNDPFLVIGAEKHDAGAEYPSYSGFIDEVRLSNVLRYPTNDFAPPTQPFTPDASTVALYHFDEGQGDLIADSSGAGGGPSTGVRNFGGSPAGPEWVTDTPFSAVSGNPMLSGATTTVTFDNPVPPGSPEGFLNGVFQGIDFGTGQWAWEGPFGPDTTNNIYFASSAGTSRTFTFSPGPMRLVSLSVFTLTAGTLRLSDNSGQTATQTITRGSMQLVQTNWTQASTTVTVTFTGGWALGVDDITHRAP
jgi:Concanavalin A-like lectin/glucanases superfamily